MSETTGHCLCGQIRWAFDGPRLWQKYCHCESCRRNCAAPVTAFVAVPVKQFRWIRREPAFYESSPGVVRRFCPTCGTPVAYSWEGLPEEIHVYATGLTDPHDFVPEAHDFWNERLAWLPLDDDLPKETA